MITTGITASNRWVELRYSKPTAGMESHLERIAKRIHSQRNATPAFAEMTPAQKLALIDEEVIRHLTGLSSLQHTIEVQAANNAALAQQIRDMGTAG